MGGVVSNSSFNLIENSNQNNNKNLNEIVILLMPTYYISKIVTKRDTKICQSCWNLILSNKTKEFLLKQQNNESNLIFQKKYNGKCLNWFTDIFFERFFDVHPISRSLSAVILYCSSPKHL